MSRRARRWPTRRRSRPAFSNAFVGVNHALAHAAGARFGIAHGRANGIFLAHVLRYNASLPSKFMPAPGYSRYVAPEKYAQIARVIGLGGKTEEIARARLFDRVDALLEEVGDAALAGCCRRRKRRLRGGSARVDQERVLRTRASGPTRGSR